PFTPPLFAHADDPRHDLDTDSANVCLCPGEKSGCACVLLHSCGSTAEPRDYRALTRTTVPGVRPSRRAVLAQAATNQLVNAMRRARSCAGVLAYRMLGHRPRAVERRQTCSAQFAPRTAGRWLSKIAVIPLVGRCWSMGQPNSRHVYGPNVRD